MAIKRANSFVCINPLGQKVTKYSSARNLSIVAQALTCLPNVGPSLPQPPNLTSISDIQYAASLANSICNFLRGGGSSPALLGQSPSFFARLGRTRKTHLVFSQPCFHMKLFLVCIKETKTKPEHVRFELYFLLT